MPHGSAKNMSITRDSTIFLTLHIQTFVKPIISVIPEAVIYSTPQHHLSSAPQLQPPPRWPHLHRHHLQSILHMAAWSKRPFSVFHGTFNETQTPHPSLAVYMIRPLSDAGLHLAQLLPTLTTLASFPSQVCQSLSTLGPFHTLLPPPGRLFP